MEIEISNYIALLNNALNTRNNLWMFYVLIITSAFGTAINEKYKSLSIILRLIITIGIGLAILFNFSALMLNMMYVDSLIHQLTYMSPDLKDVLQYVGTGNLDRSITAIPLMMWLLVNISVFVALWSQEFNNFFSRIKKFFKK